MADSDSFVLQIVCYMFRNRHVAWSQHELILPYTSLYHNHTVLYTLYIFIRELQFLCE